METNKMKFLRALREYVHSINHISLNNILLKEWEMLITRKRKLESESEFKISSQGRTAAIDISEANMLKQVKLVSGAPILKKEGEKTSKNSNDNGSQKYIDLSKFLEDMKVKLSGKVQEDKVPEWKTRRPSYLRADINRQTSNVLLGLVTADTISSRHKRLEEFLSLTYQHPEAIIHATKKNAVPILLLIRKISISDKANSDLIRQLLAIFGYVDPPSSRGLRILSIDGGGMRGIAVIKMLQTIEQICGKKIHELFDFMCGVSTGALITCCLMPPLCMNLEDIYQLYRNMSLKVFKQNTFWGTSKLIWTHAYYDTNIWEALLRDYLGESVFLESSKYPNCPKAAVISTIVNHSRVAPYIFRNYANPYKRCSEYHGGFTHTMFEAVRSSAAAPTIFEEFKTGNILHQDGGLIVNNPTAVALHEARTLWPDENISCIVSCGTGRHEPLPLTNQLRHLKAVSTSWKTTFDKILESATDTESVHTLMSDMLPDNVYYRLNPHLSGVVTMDDIDEKRIATLEEDTNMYCRRNQQKFKEIGNILTAKRSFMQLSCDIIKLQAKILKLS